MNRTIGAFAAEFIGTFALIFVGAGSICMEIMTGKVGVTGIALAHGLTIMAMAYAFGSASGGHFNPAVTAAMVSQRRLDPTRGVLYVASQLLGAAVAGLTLRAVLHGRPELFSGPPFLGACDLSGVGFKAATLLEAITTFLLVSTIYGTAVDPRGARATAPIAIGMTITLSILATGPLTGAALNPARAFGPALATGHWANWYVYWVGPLAGALAAAALYESMFLEKPT